MSFQALEWARKLPIPPTPKFLMMVIASYTDTDGACFPALTTLAEDTRQSVDSVRRWVVKCQSAGLLQRYPRWATGPKTYEIGAPGDSCPRGHRRTSDRIELLFGVDLDEVESFFSGSTPVANCEGAECEGDGSTMGATTPVATMVLPHEESLEDSNESERERAYARGEAARRFKREFRKRWPTTGVDDQAKLDKAMDDLPEDQRQPCLDGIEPFLAELKKHGRGHPPAGWKYIGERKWTLLPPRSTGSASSVPVKCWSRDWWGLLLIKIATQAPTRFMLEYAGDPGHRETTARASEMPSTEALSGMQSVPSDGHVMQAWRPWFERHGVKLPQWRERVWVWLPSVDPPEGSNAWAVTSPPTQAEAMTAETTGAT